jgi:hypothetical protein
MSIASRGSGGSARCPRCGREHAEPNLILCPACRAEMMSDAGEHRTGETKTFTVEIGPILREALASAGPMEDVDEALLRTLKRRCPDQATNLLPAITRIVEVEAGRSGVDKREAMRRLAEGEAGPEVTLRSSGGELSAGGLASVSHTFSEQTVIRAGDKEYHSLEEVPPEIRHAIGRSRMSRGAEPRKVGLRLGCSSALAALVFAALVRLLTS